MAIVGNSEQESRVYYTRLISRLRNRMRRDPQFTRDERLKLVTLTTQMDAVLKYGFTPRSEYPCGSNCEQGVQDYKLCSHYHKGKCARIAVYLTQMNKEDEVYVKAGK